MFIKGDLTVILLVDVQILHQAFMQEILKGSELKKKVSGKIAGWIYKDKNSNVHFPVVKILYFNLVSYM